MKDVVTIQLNCTPPACPQVSDFFGQEPLYIYDKPQNIVLISIYLPLFFAALIGNILVIIVVSRYRCLRSVTNTFLVNLSVSDLLVTLLCMPMAVGQATYTLWVYGDLMCKLSSYMQGVAVSSGVFTITAMSLDRYIAIRHPMSRKIINRQRARKVIVLIWFLALAVFGPILFIRKTEGFRFAWDDDLREFLYCVEAWPGNISQRSFGIFCFVAVYAIPGCVVVIAYSLMGFRLCSRHLIPEYKLSHVPSVSTQESQANKSNSNSSNVNQTNSMNSSTWQVSAAGNKLIRERRRVAKILLMLALVFAICWLPYSVLALILDLIWKTEPGSAPVPINESLVKVVTSLMPFTLLLGHLNSAVNPVLYCMLSKNFRRSVLDFLQHPIRALRGQQNFKIRMTFRRAARFGATKAYIPRSKSIPHLPIIAQSPDPALRVPLATHLNASASREHQIICFPELPQTSSTFFPKNKPFSDHSLSEGANPAEVSHCPTSSGYNSSQCSPCNVNIFNSAVLWHASKYPSLTNDRATTSIFGMVSAQSSSSSSCRPSLQLTHSVYQIPSYGNNSWPYALCLVGESSRVGRESEA